MPGLSQVDVKLSHTLHLMRKTDSEGSVKGIYIHSTNKCTDLIITLKIC